MTSTFYLTEKDLTADFLKSLKLLYKKQPFSLTISTEKDDTLYLLGTEANKTYLEKSIKNIELGKTTKVELKNFLKK